MPARRSSACPRCRRSPRGSRRRPSAAAPAAAAPPPPVTAAPFCIQHRGTSAAGGGGGSAHAAASQRRSADRSIASATGPAGRYGTGIHRALPGGSSPRPRRGKRLLLLLLLLSLRAARLGLGGRRPVPVRSRGVATAQPERRSPRTHVGDTATCSRAAPRAPAHWLPGGPRSATIGQEPPLPRRCAFPLVLAVRQSRAAGPAPLSHSRCERGRPLPPELPLLKGPRPALGPALPNSPCRKSRQFREHQGLGASPHPGLSFSGRHEAAVGLHSAGTRVSPHEAVAGAGQFLTRVPERT